MSMDEMKNQWKAVPLDDTLLTSPDFEDFGGIEELTDYRILKSDGEVIKHRNNKRKKKSSEKNTKKMKIESEEQKSMSNKEDIDMSNWCNCFVPEPVLLALKDLGFTKPTPIQELTLPLAIRDRQDILGAAETGSGKTLAFGIPVINGILSIKERKNLEDSNDLVKPLYCLILTPTRELAIQVKNHLQAVCKYTDIMVATVLGGMSSEKQKRILKKCPEIVVATPGRLWELMEEEESHLSQVPNVRFLVIDEADRMSEKGHFLELSQILEKMKSETVKKRQNFVFSATLTLVHEMPKRLLYKKKKKLQEGKLDSLIKLVGMKENPKIVDITKKTALVETLVESQIMCSTEEKDLYLYYFIAKYPGRTLIFCNSIDSVCRLRTILEYLNCNPLPLHASMHQKQRLKNVERFASSKNAILIATDVAARGLDICGIENVIHFQVPRIAETYVHRSGRTARAQNEGLSLILIDAKEAILWKKICKTLNKDKALPTFPIDYDLLKAAKERVSLVHDIDKLEHRLKRLTAQNRWFINTANEVDIELDDDLLNDLGTEQEHASKLNQIKSLKKKLKLMLQKALLPKTVFGKYPTKLGKLVCPQKTGSEKPLAILKKGKIKKKLKQ